MVRRVKSDLGTAPRSICVRISKRKNGRKKSIGIPVVKVQTFTKSRVYAFGGSPSASEAIRSSLTRRD